ncbi:hypothetical protein Tc00.1047053508149.65 [Trypanosoma cruzi]|uniref:Uncharacterized protein n=1 Tax=Trypanosoma cruzi (strain CL Brener) TaxID=353153 RepID=Q4D804_TRYCC|nr:hypothetical protein Tc00.1047053508149.65 [Trypanosoma cruzi]EAN88657.1 hypothetical protein Tc00.1047053508149.65 [Trypanosoma cruzi]|eukprot:XP_810508.1 hypothetical protein [Trypanosoma cruzi strain CL Brener]
MCCPPAWWVAAGVVCLPCVDAVSWCVKCAAGPAALSSCCLLSLSLYPLCSVPLPLVAFFSFWLTDQLTDSSDSTTGDDDCDDDDGDGAAPCGARRVGPCALAAAAAARVCDDSGGGRTQKEGCRRCVCVCRCHATTSQQTCCDSVTLTSLWSSHTAEARPTPMHLVDGLRHLSRRCREQDVLTQPRRAWSVTMAQSAVAGGIFTSRRQQRESCSCCWCRCCLLWPAMPIIVCPLIMGGMPPLVTSSAGISQHQ